MWDESGHLGKELPIEREDVDKIIRALIPFGFDVYAGKPAINMERQFPWKVMSEENRLFCLRFNKEFGANMVPTKYTYEWFLKKCDDIGMDPKRANNSLGTLGGG